MRPLKLLLLTTVFLSVLSAQAQNITGKIFDKKGETIPLVTIFVKEMNRGFAANEKGIYQIPAEPGTYTIKFQSIGFKPVTQMVTVGSSNVSLNITLEEAIYNLNQVVVNSKDNPAVWIMRKAIALGQQYKRSVSSYRSDIYLKASFNVRKFSRILKYLTPKSIEIPKEGKTYFAEMLNKVAFRAPAAYTQKIVSFRSTLPGADSKDNFPGLEFMNTSIYDNSYGDIPSPLGLNSFTYYKFTLLGSTLENNIPVYKIQVTPKRPSGKFFKGYLYISDNTYAVKNADLTFEMSFGMANVKMAFDLIEESAVLPTSYQLFADGSLLGSSGWVKSSGSLKYYNVAIIGRQSHLIAQEAPRNQAPAKQPAKPKVDPKKEAKKEARQEKRQAKIDKLVDKVNISNSEMNKLAKLMKDEEEDKKPDSLKTLEVIGMDKVEFSNDFNQKDTSYWSDIRPIPLDEEEQLAFTQRDTVRSFKDRIAALENLSRNGSRVSYFSFVTGGYIYNKDGLEIKTRGFFNPDYTYFNPIDGFTIGNRMALFKTWESDRELDIYFIPRYSINRSKLMGDATVSFLFSPRKMGWIEAKGFYGNNDIHNEQPVQPLANSISSLFLKDSYTRAMDTRGGYLSASYELANGLQVGSRLYYFDRRLVSNITNFSFLKREQQYDPNTPDNAYLGSHPLQNYTQTSVQATLTYTPMQYYKYAGNRKKYVNSDYPTFELTYQKGILSSSASNYTLLKAATWKRWDLGFLSEFWYKLEGGSFMNAQSLQLPDFYFPKVDHMLLSFAPTKQSFHLIPYYRFATPGWFVEGHMLYEADNIIIKQLPFFKGTVFTENIYLSYYNSQQLRNYVEIAYGIDKIFVLMEIKGIVGFEDGKFRSAGISISFNRD